MIYHLTTPEKWQSAQEIGEYTIESLETEGFIHLCRKKQIAGVYQRYYTAVPELVLLEVEEKKIKPALKIEESPSTGEKFPHCYGPLNLDAVISVLPFDKEYYARRD